MSVSMDDWAYDFVMGCTHFGKAFYILTIIDELSRECLGITGARSMKTEDVMTVLVNLLSAEDNQTSSGQTTVQNSERKRSEGGLQTSE